MEQNGAGLRRETSAEVKLEPNCSLKTAVSRDSTQPYVDRQETTSHWKSSDKTQNGHRESEGTEKQSRAVQKEESITPNAVSTSTVEEMSSQVTSKTLETSKDGIPEFGQFVPGLFPPNGSFSTAINNTLAQQANSSTVEQKSQAVTESLQSQNQLVDPHPPPVGICLIPKLETDIQLKLGDNLQKKPYVDRQETFSQSKSAEETETGHRETESLEKKSDSIQYSVSQTPAATVSKTVEERSLQSSFNSNETSKQRPLQASVPKSPAPVNLSRSQKGNTPDNKDEPSAKTFLQSISNYLFSWNDASSTNTSNPVLQCSEESRQQSGCPPDVSSSPQAPDADTGSSVNMLKQSSQLGTFEAMPKKESNSVPELKTTNEDVKQSLSSATTETIRAVNTRPVQTPLLPAFSLDEKDKSDVQMQEKTESTENKWIIPQAPTQLSAMDSSKPKVDFKAGLSFFQAGMSGTQTASGSTVAQTQPQSSLENQVTQRQSETLEKAETGLQESQSSHQVAPQLSTPAFFSPKSWAPVKPPVPVAKTTVQTAPLQQDSSVTASGTGEPRLASYPAASSTHSAMLESSHLPNPTLASTSEMHANPAPPTRTSQTSSDVTDRKQIQTSIGSLRDSSPFSGHDPVSATLFPSHRTESIADGIQRTKYTSAQDTVQHTMSEIKSPHKDQARATSNAQAPPATSTASKSETTEQKHSQTLTKSSEMLNRPIEQSTSQDSLLSSKASTSLSVPKAASIPYVDQQETVNKSKISEETDTGRRESESEETRKQSIQHSLSRTPTMSSSTTIEDESSHTLSQSNEIIYGAARPQDQLSLQRPTAWPSEMSHQSELTSNIVSQCRSASGQTPQVPCTQPQHQTELREERVLKTSDESQIRSNMNGSSNVPKPSLSSVPVLAPGISAPGNHLTSPPHVDKQETYSHSKISEKTDTGQRDSETAEKKRHSHEHSVSRTPTAITSTTVDEQSFQTMAETKETSGFVTMPMSRSKSCGFPSDATKIVCAQQSANLKPAGTNPVEQKCMQSMTTLSKESSSEHQVKNAPSNLKDPRLDIKPSPLHHQQQQQEQRLQQDIQTTDMFATSSDIHFKNDSGNQRTATVPQLQSHSRPFVDKQETFNKSKVSEKTETGIKETDITEKNSKLFQQSFSRTPSMSSSTTTEEKCFQSMFQTQETSGDQTFGENAKQKMTVPSPQAITNQCTIPTHVTSSAPKRISPAVQRTRSVDERGRTSREHVIPIRLAAEEAPTSTARAHKIQEIRTQRFGTATRQREHIIPVQLSPFPERGAFLQEATAGRRYSVSAAGWPGIDWAHPVHPTAWETPDWSHPVPAAAAWTEPDWGHPVPAAAGAWQESHRQQPVFCCPVVGGPQAASLAPLYAAPPLSGTPDRGLTSVGGVSRSPSSGAVTSAGGVSRSPSSGAVTSAGGVSRRPSSGTGRAAPTEGCR